MSNEHLPPSVTAGLEQAMAGAADALEALEALEPGLAAADGLSVAAAHLRAGDSAAGIAAAEQVSARLGGHPALDGLLAQAHAAVAVAEQARQLQAAASGDLSAARGLAADLGVDAAVIDQLDTAATAAAGLADTAERARSGDLAGGLAAARGVSEALGGSPVADTAFAQADLALAGVEDGRALREAMRSRDPVAAIDHALALHGNIGAMFDPPLRSGLEDNPALLDEVKSSASVLGQMARGDLAGAFGTVFDQLLEVGLAELLAAGWLEDERMQALLASDADSDDVTLLPLGRHELAWGYTPEISLQVGGLDIPAATLSMSLQLVIDLEGIIVEVQRGCARSLRAGQLCFHLTVQHGESTLYDQPTPWIALQGGLSLVQDGEGIPVTQAALRRAGEASVTRLQGVGVSVPPTDTKSPPDIGR